MHWRARRCHDYPAQFKMLLSHLSLSRTIMLDKSSIIHFGKWRDVAYDSLSACDLYCAVRVMSELSACCWKVEKDKCSLKTVLPLLAGCSSIRGKSPHPECLLIAQRICCYSANPAGSAATDWSSKGMEPDVTQHNMSSWMRQTLASLLLHLSFSLRFCSAGFYCFEKQQTSGTYWFSF